MAVTYVTTATLPTPNATDEVYIQDEAPNITGNLDWSGVAGAAIFEVPPGYLGQIGTAAGPLKLKCTTRFMYEAGAGNLYWASAGSDNNTTAKAVIDTKGTVSISGSGTITRLEIAGGLVYIGTGCVVTSLRVMGGTVYLLDDGSTDPTTVENYGGTVYIERAGTTVTHVRGTTVLEGKGATETITTVNCYGPGMQIRKVGTTGTITTLNAFGGVPDVSNLQKKLTVTNPNINMKLAGAADFLKHALVTATEVKHFDA